MTTVNLSDVLRQNTVLTDYQSWLPLGDGIEVCLHPDCVSGAAWEIVIEPFRTEKPLVSDLHGDYIFVCGESEPLSQVQGNTVWSCSDSKSSSLVRQQQVPDLDTRTNIMVTFFGHVFLVSGRKLFWSDLDNPNDWHPVQANEADFRVLEWEKVEITGLAVVEDQLFIHSPSGMYQAVYTGKPSIINIRQRLKGAGAVSQKSLQVYSQAQFFLGVDNFYLWSPDAGLNAIGADVWHDFCKKRGELKDLWSYHDKRNNEICWVSGGLIWAMNYLEKHWVKYADEGAKSHVSVFWDSENVENVWLSSESVSRELRHGEEVSEILPFSVPFLETDDLVFGDLHFVKKVDLINLDSQYSLPWMGVEVFVSARDFVTEPVVWKSVGVWQQENKLKQIDFKSVQGKVLRFKFELLQGGRFDGRKLNGGMKLNAKTIDVFDGNFNLSGTKHFNAQQVHKMNGSILWDNKGNGYGNFFLQNWGGRMDIGNTLVGPDK